MPAYRAQQAIDAADDVVVGVNRFTRRRAAGDQTFRLDHRRRARSERRAWRAVRASRSASAWRGGARGRGPRSARLRQPGAADSRRRRGEGHRGRDLRRDACASSAGKSRPTRRGTRLADPLLDVSDLSIGFTSGRRTAPVVTTSASRCAPGETAGARWRVRERQVAHGSRRSCGSCSPPGRILAGRVRFRGTRSAGAFRAKSCARSAAPDIALVFQEPMTALNPVFTVGDQIAETLVVHGRANWPAARARGRRAAGCRAHSGSLPAALARLPASAVGRALQRRAHRHGALRAVHRW